MLQKNDNVYEMPKTIRVKKTHCFACLHPLRIILHLLEKAGLRIYEEARLNDSVGQEKELPIDSQKAREESQP